MATDCPPQLRAAYRAGRLLPFVGAGVPRSVVWDQGEVRQRGPSWEDLVDQAAYELGFENPELARVRGTDLQILEYFKLMNDGQTAKLTNWLARLMSPPSEAIANSAILQALVPLERCKLIYTTNYDDFIERAFQMRQRPVRTVVLESQMGKTVNETEIVKFHGDLNHPGEIVLTESDYEKRLALGSPLDARLRADLLGRIVLFVGYSFRDPNVSYIFRLWQRDHAPVQDGVSEPKAYIALPDPSEFEYKLFHARKIQVIPLESASMTADTAALLHGLLD